MDIVDELRQTPIGLHYAPSPTEPVRYVGDLAHRAAAAILALRQDVAAMRLLASVSDKPRERGGADLAGSEPTKIPLNADTRLSAIPVQEWATETISSGASGPSAEPATAEGGAASNGGEVTRYLRTRIAELCYAHAIERKRGRDQIVSAVKERDASRRELARLTKRNAELSTLALAAIAAIPPDTLVGELNISRLRAMATLHDAIHKMASAKLDTSALMQLMGEIA